MSVYKQTDEYLKGHDSKDQMYDFAQAYTKYANTAKDYGNGDLIFLAEAHTVKFICENPGSTLTDIVNYWGRTKGTVSAQITKLEKRGYIKRVQDEKNLKIFHLFATEKGEELNRCHYEYDLKESFKALDNWLKDFSEEDINTFSKMLESYTKHIQKGNKG